MGILIYCSMILSAAAAIPAIQPSPISSLRPSPHANESTLSTVYASPTFVTANGWPWTPYWVLIVPGLSVEILEYSDIKVTVSKARVLDALTEIETKIHLDGRPNDPFPPQSVTHDAVTAIFSPPDSPYPVPPLKPFSSNMARSWIHTLRALTLLYGPTAISSAEILMDNLPAMTFSLDIARSHRLKTLKRNVQSYASALDNQYNNTSTEIGEAWPQTPFRSEITGRPLLTLTVFEYGSSIDKVSKADIMDTLDNMERGIRTEGRGSEAFAPQTLSRGILSASFDPPYPMAMRTFTKTQAASVLGHLRELVYIFGAKELLTAQIHSDSSLRALFSLTQNTSPHDTKIPPRTLPPNTSTAPPPKPPSLKTWPPVPFHFTINGPLSITFTAYNNTPIPNPSQTTLDILGLISIVDRSGFDPSYPVRARQFASGDVVASFIHDVPEPPYQCTRRQAVEVVAAVYGLSTLQGPTRIQEADVLIRGMTVMRFRLEVVE